GGRPGLPQASYPGAGAIGVSRDAATGEHHHIGGPHRLEGRLRGMHVLPRRQGRNRQDGGAQRLPQRRNRGRYLIIQLVALAPLSAEVKVVGAGQASQLLPGPIRHAQTGVAHGSAASRTSRSAKSACPVCVALSILFVPVLASSWHAAERVCDPPQPLRTSTPGPGTRSANSRTTRSTPYSPASRTAARCATFPVGAWLTSAVPAPGNPGGVAGCC